MSEKEATSANNNNETVTEDSDIVTLTLNDILDMENEMMEDAAAVLGGSNDKSCSYNDGYLKRQALYSCLTCLPDSQKNPEQQGAGICLACSYHCHDGHELIELYTKRNFRCDCGNKKFTNGVKCNLEAKKSDLNELNMYNQNFGGLYCTCHRPYPDPEDSNPDEMIQCIICEDWYHSRHLGVDVPTGTFAEMVCVACVTKHEFLLHYDGVKMEKLDENHDDTEENVEKCKKPSEKSTISTKFWSDILWRKQLCRCKDCLEMYENENVMFLIDPEDPVHLYEEKGKAKVKENIKKSDEKLTDSINSLDRVQMVEVIAGYNDFKQNLAEYLQKFVESKKVVREEDIKEFFDGMRARKKQKVGAPPTFCR